jgi:endonuclease/exonuclease/phosphatase family metal-dependent hydrolase
MKRLLSIGLALALPACASLPPERLAPCSGMPAREIRLSQDGAVASTRISVLTYNVEGLAWPARSGRRRQLDEMAERIAQLRAEGRAPDLILFQEVFSRAASRAVSRIGYPNLVAGPSRTQLQPPRDGPRLPGARRPQRGELGIKLASSGLVTVSEFPVVRRDSRPFPVGSCAGRDCLANKGMLYAEVAVPGVPITIDVFNTHMNSQRASRVPEARHLASHQTQAAALVDYLAQTGDIARPLIFGGDFNMRHSAERFEEFRRLQPLQLVHRFCIDWPGDCDVRISWDGDEPWMDTHDLQLFWSGGGVGLRPVRVEAMFDGGDQPQLSDHDGFLVTYELSWPSVLQGQACPAGARR